MNTEYIVQVKCNIKKTKKMINHKTIAVISKKPEIVGFDGKKYKVLRQIQMIEHDNYNEIFSYKVKSSLVEKVNNIWTEKAVLSDWKRIDYSYNMINILHSNMTITKGLTKTQKEVSEMKQGLLIITKKEKAWGITGWEYFVG